MASEGLVIKVDTSKLNRRLSQYKAQLLFHLRASWPEILDECIADVASRAPEPEEELMFILGDANYPEVTEIPKYRIHGHNIVWAKDFPASGERVHFARSPGMWIKEAIVNPETYEYDVDNLTFNLGLVPALEKLTPFTYVNISRRLGQFPYSTPYGVWSFFEYGLTTSVTPNMSHWTSWWGHPKLKPMGDSASSPFWVKEMQKSYPASGMYTDFKPSFLIDAITSRIRAVKF